MYVSFFGSALDDVMIDYIGHAEEWARVETDDEPAGRDVAVRFLRGDTLLAGATLAATRKVCGKSL